ncbi:hypothetical protein ACLILY_25555, partial [Mycobacterium sp. MS3]
MSAPKRMVPDPDRSCPTCRSFDPYFGFGGRCLDPFHDIAAIAIFEAEISGTELDLDAIPV